MFEPNDILNHCYQLQTLLGQTATGHQTWLAIELPSQPLQRFLMQQVRRKLPLVLFDPPKLPQFTLKLLAFSPQIQWEEIKLFEREAQILKTLHHPKIPRYRDYFETESPRDNSIPWFGLVQNYIPGYSLQTLLNQHYNFSEKQLKNFAKQVLEILQYLHGLNPPILHRDIKPSNLILGIDHQLYLIDFGAVQAKASVTGVTFTVVGSGGYTPLEQFWGKAVPSSDLYGLGATLIHLATGIAPVDLPQHNSQLQFRDHLNLSQGFIQWLEILTAIAPEQRFQSAEDALHELQYLSIPSLKFFQSSPSIKPSSSILAIPETRVKLKKDETSMLIKFANQSNFFSQVSRLKSLPLKAKIILGIMMLLGGISLEILLSKNSPAISNLWASLLGIGLIIKLWHQGKSSVLSFEPKRVRLFQKFLFIPYKTDQENLEEIIGFFAHQDKNDQYKLSLNTKKKVYFLPYLSQEESRWLLQEIQNWLKKQADASQ